MTKTMTLDKIAAVLGVAKTLPDMVVSAVTEDSRRATSACLFVAVKGDKEDGHDFAAAAVQAGAAAVLGNRTDITEMHGVPYLYYEKPRRAAAILAHLLAGTPSERQCVIGITGTNGKTSTACMTQTILERSGHVCANFGTLGYDLGTTRMEARHTTPFGEDLAALFAQAEQTGCNHVVMEVSSHALEQDRVAGIAFNIAAFTNLTQDHLDYHETMEGYLAAKLKLFEMVRTQSERSANGAPCFAVVNKEDAAAPHFQAIMPERCYTYGDGGQVCARSVQIDGHGARFNLASPWGVYPARIRLAGRHNVLNALCAFTICAGLDIPPEEVLDGMAALESVPGRFESVLDGQPFQVIVDYAHTDDGLRNALIAARAVCTGRVIAVFGCGGDRDKGKRPKMGAVVASLADYIVVTSDNPRTEDPCRILLDIEVGLQHGGRDKHTDYRIIESRREAIDHAVATAQAGDLVLIAGKGHETYQIIGSERRHFDDREEARVALRKRFS